MPCADRKRLNGVSGISGHLCFLPFLDLQLALPYWNDPDVKSEARWRLAGVVALTVATTGVRYTLSIQMLYCGTLF